MSYKVLALKYRPQTFDDVVGQPHVTTTLTNAIRSDRVAHSILFTGPRGTGKTTIARILAKALNCQEGMSPTPCNQCKICTDITHGHCTDVFEIDGASNNSVDQIRDLRENVTYMPSSAKYKIYIIDEVHMLSTAAFNALLKTLEEPPAHVMFIFATTEVHKIPATILSRCQRHDLGRINLSSISNHLGSLCSQEGFKLTSQSLDLIAQEADGSIRDSLSLLDRILSSSDTPEINHETVLDYLGVIDTQIMHDIATAIFESNGEKIIGYLDQINDSGMDLKKYYSDLVHYFRNLNVIKICGQNSSTVNLAESEKERISQLVSNLSSPYLSALLQILLDDENLVRYSSHTRTAIEMILLKLIRINPGKQIDQIIKKLDGLAKQIAGSQNTDPITYKPVQKTPEVPSPSLENQAVKQVETEQIQESIKTPDIPQDQQAVHDSVPREYEQNWQGFLQKIESSFPFMYALLIKGHVSKETSDQITVELKNCSSFDKRRLETKKKELEKECSDFLNKHLVILMALSNDVHAPNNKKKNELKARQAVRSHPFVVQAQKIFDGEIIN